jgi:peptide/nickel transport system substrate-binding protein
MRLLPGAHARLFLTAAALIGLSACQTAPTEAPAEATASEMVTAEAAPTEAETGSTTPADTIVFAHAGDASKLDPADVTDSESLLITWHVFEGLTRYRPGTTEPEPSLATEWTTSDDGLTWTFTLRPEVMFHDGTPFNADAVVWNFERWSDTANATHFPDWEFAYFADMFQGFKADDKDADGTPDSFLESVTKVDDMTVQMNLRRPNAPLLQTLAMGNFGFSSPTAVEASGSSYGTPDGNPIAISTGPYMVQSWAPGDSITLAANPTYWGEAPIEPTLVFRVIPENTARFLAVSNGEIDGMNQVNPEDIAPAQANSDLQVIFEPANNVGYLGFNQAHAPWGNVDCRRAVAHAIDKAGIVSALYAGDAEVATQMLPPSLWGHNAAIEDYAFDATAATEAMTACTAAETMPAEVVLYVPPIPRFYFPKPAELGEAIQANLAAIGITTRIESPEWESWLTQVRAGDADLFLLGWGGDNGDPDNYLCVFFCGGDGAWNSAADGTAMPPDEELNTLLREASTLSDQAARQTAYETANQMIHDKVISVPLVHRTPPIIFRSTVAGYTSSPIQTILTGVTKD